MISAISTKTNQLLYTNSFKRVNFKAEQPTHAEQGSTNQPQLTHTDEKDNFVKNSNQPQPTLVEAEVKNSNQPQSTHVVEEVKNSNQPQPTKWQSTIEKQIHSPLDVFLTLVSFGAFGGFVLYCLRGNKFKDFSSEKLKTEFSSLKNDAKVPTLETCKSINKDLKEMLEYQLKLSNCDPKILEETGYPKINKAFLLSGPPGIGKTYFSKIYAKSMDAEFMEMIVPDLLSRWVGATEENMSAFFKKILKTANKNPDKKYVVTMNEIDSVLIPAQQLSGDGGSTHFASLRRQRALFLTYLDKIMSETNNVTIIGTTNFARNSKSLDGASMSRFQNVIEVPYPDKDCLYEALKTNLKQIKDIDTFWGKNEEALRQISDTMANRKFSFRNLEYLVNDSKTQFLCDKLKDRNVQFKCKYLEDALKKIKKSDGEAEVLKDTTK